MIKSTTLRQYYLNTKNNKEGIIPVKLRKINRIMGLNFSLHFCYSFLANLFALFSLIYEVITGNKIKSRNICYKKIANGNNILFYAASMGESLSVMAFVKEISEKYPNFNIIIATQTQSSANTVANYIKKLELKNTFHIYAVLDASFMVKKFLNKINPCMVFWVESEFWYNHLRLIKKRNIKLILLNARFSKRALKKWQKVSFILKKLLSYFDIITAKTTDIASNITRITGFKVNFIGDIKVSSSLFLSESLPYGNLTKLNFIKQKPSYVAISTHSNEEEILINIHSKIVKKYSDFITIIIPRHIERCQDIVKQAKSNNIKVALLSQVQEQALQDFDILIVDSYGMVKDICSLVKVAFVGKSISNKVQGGQNPYEPIFFGLQTIMGLNFQNFQNDVESLNKLGLLKVVSSTKELEKALVEAVFNNISSSNKLSTYLAKVKEIPAKHLLFFKEVFDEQYE